MTLESIEAETSSNTKQSSIFKYIDPNEYGFYEFDDMINGNRTMMHYVHGIRDAHQSTLFG